jgi:hypothetical protein
MDRHAATRRLHNLAEAVGIRVTRAHPHIRSSSLFKHARHRMIADGFRGAATMKNS